MTRSQITKAVNLLVAAEAARTEALWAERSFATLHLVDDLRRKQFAAENEYTRFMRPTFESITMDEGMALSKRIHRLAGV